MGSKILLSSSSNQETECPSNQGPQIRVYANQIKNQNVSLHPIRNNKNFRPLNRKPQYFCTSFQGTQMFLVFISWITIVSLHQLEKNVQSTNREPPIFLSIQSETTKISGIQSGTMNIYVHSDLSHGPRQIFLSLNSNYKYLAHPIMDIKAGKTNKKES